MIEQEVIERAQRFWRDAGRAEPFPRSLESTITWALPLAVVKLPRLGLEELRKWLALRGVSLTGVAGSESLRGALVARAGRGLVFLEGSDPDDERRFSLAHEVAHFLCDYLDPRERALGALGEPIREVLDGKRPPRPEERFSALLRGVELGIYAHWMERSLEGAIASAAVLAGEDRADRLALELLAPSKHVVERVRHQGLSTTAETVDLLVRDYGLPRSNACTYIRFLARRRRAAQNFRQWLGFPASRTSGRRSE